MLPDVAFLPDRDLPADWRAGTSLGQLDLGDGPVPVLVAGGVAHDMSRVAPTASLLTPLDLQCVKACGVTFATSAVKRVIEEGARGVAAADFRTRLEGRIGGSIRAVVREGFVRQGACVHFVNVAEPASAALVQTLTPGAAHPPVFHRIDLTDTDAVAAAMVDSDAGLDGIDVLVKNADTDDRHRPEAVAPAYWDYRMAVNLRHLFFCAKAAVPGMRRVGAASSATWGRSAGTWG